MVLPYKPPAGATPEGIRKVEELRLLPVVSRKKKGSKVKPPDLDVILGLSIPSRASVSYLVATASCATRPSS